MTDISHYVSVCVVSPFAPILCPFEISLFCISKVINFPGFVTPQMGLCLRKERQ
jgi:hypothetical protein